MAEGNDVNYWLNRWDKNQTGWHVNGVNPNLLIFMHQLLGHDSAVSPGSASGKKIFLPLCGKTKDIAYLLNLGFFVFGVDASLKAMQELEQENFLGLQFNEEESTYATPDKRLVIYFGDFFQCPIEKWGPFDCVWDRGSFIAMEYEFRAKYVQVMRRSVFDSNQQCINFRYLLETFYFDKSLFEGPPRSADYSTIVENFGSWANIKELLNYLVEDEHREQCCRCLDALNGKPCHTIVFLLQPKNC